MLPQTVYRFHHQAARDGVTQGAVYSFGLVDDDPDALLMVWNDPRTEEWYWLAAAATSRPLRCSEGGRVVWEKPAYWSNPRSPEDRFVDIKLSDDPTLVRQQ